MSLGWGWRGYIGGGPFGAMIPGAMVGLILCRLLGLDAGRSALAAAFAAVGVGFGGEMTYGQTVGFVRESHTAAWGLLGLATKGGVWGLLGGTVVGIGFHLACGRRGPILSALVVFVAAVAAGWAAVNRPKLVYFSNLADRPREEVWAGLLLGAAALLWLYRRTAESAEPVGRFALGGLVGGLVGFGLGGLWIFAGAQVASAPEWIPWWKLMEFTFGLLFGAGLGWAAGGSREWLQPIAEIQRAAPAVAPPWLEAALTAVAAATVFLAEPFLAVRFSYAVVGALMLAAAAFVPRTRWPIVIAVTAAAFFLDWFDYVLDDPPFDSVRLGGAMTAAATLTVCAVLVSLRRGGELEARSGFRLLTVSAFLTSWARVVLLGSYGPEELATHACFVGLLAALVRWDLRRPSA